MTTISSNSSTSSGGREIRSRRKGVDDDEIDELKAPKRSTRTISEDATNEYCSLEAAVTTSSNGSTNHRSGSEEISENIADRPASRPAKKGNASAPIPIRKMSPSPVTPALDTQETENNESASSGLADGDLNDGPEIIPDDDDKPYRKSSKKKKRKSGAARSKGDRKGRAMESGDTVRKGTSTVDGPEILHDDDVLGGDQEEQQPRGKKLHKSGGKSTGMSVEERDALEKEKARSAINPQHGVASSNQKKVVKPHEGTKRHEKQLPPVHQPVDNESTKTDYTGVGFTSSSTDAWIPSQSHAAKSSQQEQEDEDAKEKSRGRARAVQRHAKRSDLEGRAEDEDQLGSTSPAKQKATVQVGAYRVRPGGVVEGSMPAPSATAINSRQPQKAGPVQSDERRISDLSSLQNSTFQSSVFDCKGNVGGNEAEQKPSTRDLSSEPIVAELVPNESDVTALLAERLQREFAQQIEQQVQDRLQKQGQVRAEVVTVGDNIHAGDGDGDNSDNKSDSGHEWNYWKWVGIGICVMVVLTIGVVVAVVVLTKNPKPGPMPPTPSPAYVVTSPPTVLSMGRRFDDLFVALRPYLLDLATGLDDEVERPNLYGLEDISEYQLVTLDWLANVDDAKIRIVDQARASAIESDETPLQLEQALERFVVALIYFSTAGEIWSFPYGFLSGKPVCDWNNAVQEKGVFCEGQSVQEIRLAENKLFGSFPTEIGLLSNLEVLDWDSNSVYGTLPSELFGLSALRIFWMQGNSMRGPISSEIGQLKQLGSFDVAENSITGSIPTEIGLLNQSLFLLFLRDNQLGGGIPSEIGSLTELRFLDLEFSQLKGPIPTALGQLVNLENLYFERNSFNGTIPTEFGLMRNLTTLFLYRNNLDGTVPSELEFLTKLTNIRLEENSLTGGLDLAFCKNIAAFRSLERFQADCGGATPDLSCFCCTHCCDEAANCNPV